MQNEDFDTTLGQNYPLSRAEEAANTKERILLEATLLFAAQGYDAVSIKDIAGKAGISPASLYNHFDGKEALWDAIIDHAANLYALYFTRLDEARAISSRFEDVLEAMFIELTQVVNIFTYYAFSLMQTEQFHSEKTGALFINTFMRDSIAYIRGAFDECVANGSAPPFDTNTVATFFMHTVHMGIDMRIHEHLGHSLPYDITGMFNALHSYILNTVLHKNGEK